MWVGAHGQSRSRKHNTGYATKFTLARSKFKGGNKIERAFRVVMIRCASASTIYFPVYPDQFRELLAWLTIPVQ